LSLTGFIVFWQKYIFLQKAQQSAAIDYGTRQLMDGINKISGDYEEVIISKNVSEPQIYVAFYTQMDPNKFQQASKNWKLVNGWVDQMDTYNLGKYTFKAIDRIVDFKKKNTLLVGKIEDFHLKLCQCYCHLSKFKASLLGS